MYLFIGIVIIVFGILQIILFFKLWIMTNDIREIRNQYINKSETYDINVEELDLSKINTKNIDDATADLLIDLYSIKKQ